MEGRRCTIFIHLPKTGGKTVAAALRYKYPSRTLILDSLRFLVVGLTERFDESFILIRRALGWRVPMYETHNVSAAELPAPPTPAAIDQIRERNRFDLALYEHAAKLFAAAVASHGPSFAREVAAFRVLNRIPNAIGPRMPTRWRHSLRPILPR
jgi:Galactose-3-O-sulfotransferase